MSEDKSQWAGGEVVGRTPQWREELLREVVCGELGRREAGQRVEAETGESELA